MKKNLFQNWMQFTQERFSLGSHIPMAVIFALSHLAMSEFSWKAAVLTSLGCLVFLFELRLFDELKDYDVDCQVNPHRPLPRGLLTQSQVRVGVLIALVVELVAFALIGPEPFGSLIVAICYSFLMLEEFFIKDFIRPHLTFYGMIHTVSLALLSLAIFSGARNASMWHLPNTDYIFALACWLVFNIYEVGRKTFATEEERTQVESYSSLWGRSNAIVLVFVQVIFVSLLISYFSAATGPEIQILHAVLTFLMSLLGAYYLTSNSIKSAQVYRAGIHIYIVSALMFSGIINIYTMQKT